MSAPTIPCHEAQQLLKQHFTYNHETGEMFQIKNNRPVKVGYFGGSYYRITVQGLRRPWLKRSPTNPGGLSRYVYLHHLAWLLYYGHWPALEVDHINLDKLDNRICNLRLVTDQQQNCNKQKYSSYRGKRCSSRYKGVYYSIQDKTWVCKISYNRRSYRLGRYASEEAAAQAYDTAAKKLFKQYAYLNFP